MSAEPHKDTFGDERFESEFVQDRLDQLDGNLMDELQSDSRFSSGVPNEQRTNALDFIQMTGLTRPSSTEGIQQPQTAPESLNPAAPLSFYEQGVADVDHTVGPAAMEASNGVHGEDILSAPSAQPEDKGAIPPSVSVDAFKDIIADLTGEQEALELSPGEASQEHSPVEELPPAMELTPSMNNVEQIPADEPLDLGGLDAIAPSPVTTPAPAPFESQKPVDDFDQLLDAGSQPPSTVMAPVSGSNAHLAEAEQLLHELEQQPREEYRESETPETTLPSQYEATPPYALKPHGQQTYSENIEGVEENQNEIYKSSPPSSRHRSSRHSRWRRQTLRRLMGFTIVVAVLAVLVAGVLIWVIPYIQGNQSHWDAAQGHLQAGRFGEAAKSFEFYAAKADLPSEEKALAYFESANAAYRKAMGDHTRSSRDNLNLALAKFQTFTEMYPSDPKMSRVRQLMGIIYYKLDVYSSAIELLKDSAHFTQVSYADLPALRTLARAYRDNQNFAEAESTYLQVAAHPENYSAEVDHSELGDMLQSRALETADINEMLRLQQQAVDSWSSALLVPGINPLKREEIVQKRNLMESTINGAPLSKTNTSDDKDIVGNALEGAS
jgi:tetratricopeptide (TPR) repeat protein